jgi:multidrug resistance protein MdtO
VVLFDNWLWPDPGEGVLLESLKTNMGQVRARLLEASSFYLTNGATSRPQAPLPTSDLPAHMALLDQATAEGVSGHRHAILLAAITRVARIALEVDRLIVAVRQDVAGQIRTMATPELPIAVEAVASALDELAQELPTEITVCSGQPTAASRIKAKAAMDALSARIIQIRPMYIDTASSDEIENFAAFVDSLAALTGHFDHLLDKPPQPSSAVSSNTAVSGSISAPDPALVRYSIKVGLCAVAGYVIGLTTQRLDLTTILITILITALPTYGAALHKMILRVAGALIGGAISLLAIIIVSPNFDSLGAYLVALFIVFYVSAYASLGSGRVAYAGRQIGTTFALVFAGLGPSVDIYQPLWRIWGILLGTLIVAAGAFTLWPEYAGDSLLPRLRRVIQGTLALAPRGSAANNEDEIQRVNSDTMQVLAEILEVADDAQLEGRASRLIITRWSRRRPPFAASPIDWLPYRPAALPCHCLNSTH